MCLNETYSGVHIDKNLSHKFTIENGLKQGDALQICFGICHQESPTEPGGILNGTHKLLAYADDVNIVGENIGTIQNNTKALLDASKRLVWR
jgi:hypothetical protein